GLDRLGEPLLQFGDALVGDDVALAIGAGARLGLGGDHLAVAGQPGERRVDLSEREWLAAAEERVVVALEVVAVARLALEQAQQGQGNRHALDNTLSVYAAVVPVARTVSRRRVRGPSRRRWTAGSPAGRAS